MGGRLEAGREYIVTINDIIVQEDAITYPESIRYTIDAGKKRIRTVSDLNEEERKIFDETPLRPRMYQGVESTDKDGKVQMEPKASDRVTFEFMVDDTGSITGMYEFAYNLYDGFKPTKKFREFVEKATGQNIDGRSGTLNLWDIFPEGSKYLVRTNNVLKDGKWASFDQTSLRPYKDGMALKNDSGGDVAVTDEEVLEFLRGLVKENNGPINPLAALSRGTDKFGASYSDVYRALKDSGKIIIDGGKLTVG